MEITLNEQSKLVIKELAAFVRFPNWEVPDGVRYGYSARILGHSKGIYGAMNLGFNRGDDPKPVKENYRDMCEALSIPMEKLVFTKQTHLCNIRKVSAKDCGNGIMRENAFTDIDGLMTDEPGVPLVVFTADCVPLFFYDREKHAIALVHAGWRGTVHGIAAETVRRMSQEYGSVPSDILVAVGPSICRECFEIGPEVAEEFEKAFPVPMDEEGSILFHGRGDRFQADLWAANRWYLESAGVPRKNITMSDLCTMCRPQMFFSHRATNGQRGSNAGFLMLAE